jgi:hypothetical protein
VSFLGNFDDFFRFAKVDLKKMQEVDHQFAAEKNKEYIKIGRKVNWIREISDHQKLIGSTEYEHPPPQSDIPPDPVKSISFQWIFTEFSGLKRGETDIYQKPPSDMPPDPVKGF